MHASIVLDHFAHVHLVVIVPVQNTHMAQVIAPDIRVLNIGLSLHPLPYSVRYRVGGVCLVFNRLLDKAYGKAVAKSAVCPTKMSSSVKLKPQDVSSPSSVEAQ